jgi:hypothetical protein
VSTPANEAAPPVPAESDAPEDQTVRVPAAKPAGAHAVSAAVAEPAATAAHVPVAPPLGAGLRRSRLSRYRPHPGVTLAVFALGVAIGAAVFAARLEPPAQLQPLPTSPFPGVAVDTRTPLVIAAVGEGLDGSAEQLPLIMEAAALDQLRGVSGDLLRVIGVSHLGTVTVGNQSVSAIVILGVTAEGRVTRVPLIAKIVDNRILEFQ